MNRWIPCIFVFLVLGANVNLVVAWGCAFRAHSISIPVQESDASVYAPTWERLALPGWDAEPTRGSEAYEFGVRYLDASAGHVSQWTFVGHSATEMCAGWPIFVMRYVIWYDSPPPRSTMRGRVMVPMAIARRSHFIVPVQPVWPGFAINTVIYAVVLWLLFAGPFALRRRRRIKRGLCVKCAYDLRGTPRGAEAAACPECGVATRLVAPAQARAE